MSTITLTPDELEDMLDRAARRGAKQALSALGLHDESAARDINEMRDLLDVWRDTRKGIWSTFVKVTALATLLLTISCGGKDSKKKEETKATPEVSASLEIEKPQLTQVAASLEQAKVQQEKQ